MIYCSSVYGLTNSYVPTKKFYVLRKKQNNLQSLIRLVQKSLILSGLASSDEPDESIRLFVPMMFLIWNLIESVRSCSNIEFSCLIGWFYDVSGSKKFRLNKISTREFLFILVYMAYTVLLHFKFYILNWLNCCNKISF